MAVSQEEARRELARRELARRQASSTPSVGNALSGPPPIPQQPTPQQPMAEPGAVSPGQYGRYLAGLGENALSVGTGLASMIPAGLMGIVSAAVPGGQTGGEKVDEVRSALTYQPRLPEGQQIAQGLGRPAEALDTGLTDAFDLTGPRNPMSFFNLIPEDARAAVSAGTRTNAEAAAMALPASRGFKAVKGTPKTPGPTTEQLFKIGREQFNRARQLGGGVRESARARLAGNVAGLQNEAVSYTHLTLPTSAVACRSRWSPYH